MESQVLCPVTGIFDELEAAQFTRYRIGLAFTGLVVGGVPKKPEVIESWLRARILGGDEELRLMLVKTLEDLEIEVPADASREEIITAAKSIAATQHGNTFRRDERGLGLADYQIKALLKESTNILYPYAGGHKWGPTKKTPRSFLAERIFVDGYLIPLGRVDPDGTMTQVGHITGPQGKRSTLNHYDFCVQPEISFVVSSSEDAISRDQWVRIWIQAQRLGLGALRSMGYGQFKVTAFDVL